ncbi:MAG: ribbon-helix-helix domain-containing protein [Pseudomonadota bacterium]
MTVKRSITIAGHRTSVSLEAPFWDDLQRIANQRQMSLAALVGEIDAERLNEPEPANLSSALRVYVLEAVRHGRATD